MWIYCIVLLLPFSVISVCTLSFCWILRLVFQLSRCCSDSCNTAVTSFSYSRCSKWVQFFITNKRLYSALVNHRQMKPFRASVRALSNKCFCLSHYSGMRVFQEVTSHPSWSRPSSQGFAALSHWSEPSSLRCLTLLWSGASTRGCSTSAALRTGRPWAATSGSNSA